MSTEKPPLVKTLSNATIVELLKGYELRCVMATGEPMRIPGIELLHEIKARLMEAQVLQTSVKPFTINVNLAGADGKTMLETIWRVFNEMFNTGQWPHTNLPSHSIFQEIYDKFLNEIIFCQFDKNIILLTITDGDEIVGINHKGVEKIIHAPIFSGWYFTIIDKAVAEQAGLNINTPIMIHNQ